MSIDDDLTRTIAIEARLGMVAQGLGRDANALIQEMRELPFELIEAFVETDFVVTDGEITYVLNISQTMPDTLTAALQSLSAHSITIVTAWNPYSAKLSNYDNRERQSLLERVLRMRGEHWLSAKGTSKDGSWAEESFAILNLSHTQAAAIGRVFQQHAVVFCNTGSVVELVPCFTESA
ncbi:MAG TPA: DUF3293 domain-containing protein [Candidatus Acidoferrum sp.]|nr:DUF3293 domain-containing protein [Candidatus Acidoferrum sp.]